MWFGNRGMWKRARSVCFRILFTKWNFLILIIQCPISGYFSRGPMAHLWNDYEYFIHKLLRDKNGTKKNQSLIWMDPKLIVNVNWSCIRRLTIHRLLDTDTTNIVIYVNNQLSDARVAFLTFKSAVDIICSSRTNRIGFTEWLSPHVQQKGCSLWRLQVHLRRADIH